MALLLLRPATASWSETSPSMQRTKKIDDFMVRKGELTGKQKLLYKKRMAPIPQQSP